MNIDVLKDLSPAEPASAGDLPPFGLFAAGVYPFLEFRWFHEAYYRVLEAFAAGRVRRLIVTMPPRQERRGFDPAARLPVGAQSRSADRHRLLFGFVGFEVQPARAAYHRFARICGLFPGNDHQAGSQASGVPAYG